MGVMEVDMVVMVLVAVMIVDMMVPMGRIWRCVVVMVIMVVDKVVMILVAIMIVDIMVRMDVVMMRL